MEKVGIWKLNGVLNVKRLWHLPEPVFGSHFSSGDSCYRLIGMSHELNKKSHVKPICYRSLMPLHSLSFFHCVCQSG